MFLSYLFLTHFNQFLGLHQLLLYLFFQQMIIGKTLKYYGMFFFLLLMPSITGQLNRSKITPEVSSELTRFSHFKTVAFICFPLFFTLLIFLLSFRAPFHKETNPEFCSLCLLLIPESPLGGHKWDLANNSTNFLLNFCHLFLHELLRL